jgi:hypothetical protein
VYRAQVDEKGGMLEVELRGEEPVVNQALDWLRQLGIGAEEGAR